MLSDRRPLFLVPLLAVSLLVSPVRAAETVMIAGLGTVSCGAWTTARRDRSSWGYEQWVFGYLSGTADNLGGAVDPLRGLDKQAVWSWMDNYCRAHPLEKIYKAGREFLKAHPR